MGYDTLAKLHAAVPRTLGQADKPILAHYTGYIAYEGILKNREIWATNIHYLNDKEEFKHGFSVLRIVLDSHLQDRHPEFASICMDHFDDLVRRISGQNIHVASFTEKPNLLSQWRGYTPVGGVSIAFLYDHLKACAKRFAFQLLPCIYRHEDQLSVSKEVMTGGIHDAQINKGSKIDELRLFITALVFDFAEFAPLMKSRYFKAEREWRMVRTSVAYPDKRVRYHVTSTFVRPYFAVELGGKSGKDDIGIDNITIGPCQNFELMCKSLHNLPECYGVKADSFTFSQIPYRVF